MALLKEVSQAHMAIEQWHMMGLGLNELKHVVGKVKTYPQIMSQIWGKVSRGAF